ncbi:MAG: universal stress protein [Mycobacteriales bacterium]
MTGYTTVLVDTDGSESSFVAVDRAAEVAGDPVDQLLAIAGRLHADLVVVGNRRLNSLAGRLLGSVPANIAQRAACDVLIVQTTGRPRR